MKRDARIASAKAEMRSAIREAEANQRRMEAQCLKDTNVALAKREYDLRKADNDKKVQTQKAISDLAKKLQQAKTRQEVIAEKMKVKIVQRTRKIDLEIEEILRRENELQATVMKPAEALKYQMETIAEAEKQRVVLEAQAEAESIKLKGEAEAFAIEQKAKVHLTPSPPFTLMV